MAGEASLLKQYNEFTRYLRPVRPTSFSDREVLSALLQHMEPDDFASCSQLLGDRKGVIRVTFRTELGVKKLDELVQERTLQINAIPLGMVDDSGAFLVVTLENVPQCISDSQVEEEMQKYGSVVGSSRDFTEYKGKRIENERRRVLFTSLNNPANIPKELQLFGTTIYTKFRGPEQYTASSRSREGGILRRHSTNDEQSYLKRRSSSSAYPATETAGSLEAEGGKAKGVLGRRYSAKEQRASALEQLSRSAGLDRE